MFDLIAGKSILKATKIRTLMCRNLLSLFSFLVTAFSLGNISNLNYT